MPTVQPIPQTPLRDDPQQDSIWKRYLDDLRRSVSSSISSYSISSIAASSIVGVISVTGGGTGFSSYVVGDLLYADTTTSLSRFADVATGNAVISGGAGLVPVYGKIGLTTHVSSTLAVGSGGTQLTSYAEADLLYASGPSLLSTIAAAASTQVLHGHSSRPYFGPVLLAADVSGTLPVARGGTGLTAVGEVYSLLRTNEAGTANEYTPWPTTRNSVLSGETLTIVSSRAYVTASPFVNEGTIVNSGVMLVL